MAEDADYKCFQCGACGWIYDEKQGAPEEGLAPGTRWSEVSETWCCPSCGASKADFEMVEF